MNFEYWLKKQKNRNDPVGDLSKDFILSEEKNFLKSFKKYHPCDGASVAYKKALEEYADFLLSKLDKVLDAVSESYEEKIVLSLVEEIKKEIQHARRSLTMLDSMEKAFSQDD